MPAGPKASYEDGAGDNQRGVGNVALIYFALAACVGDFLCRRFLPFRVRCTPMCGSNPVAYW